MASDEAQRNFRKLKLDTTGWHIPPSKDDVEATGIPVPAAQILGRTGNRNLQVNTVIPEEAAEDASEALLSDLDGRAERDSTCGSVMFESQILLKDGDVEPIVEPVLTYGKSPKRRGRWITQELAQTNTGVDGSARHPSWPETETEASEDSNQPPYRKGEPRWPLLQATADELAEEREQPKESVLSPDSTIPRTSPLLDGTRSTEYFFGEHGLSSSIASSPVQFPSLSNSGTLPSPRVREGQRRRTTDRTGAVRRGSRRSSARSPMAKSPAGSYLAQFTKSSAPPEPDEDGQTIGEHGEYIIGRQIGYGGFSVIKEVYSLENQRQVMRAVKIVRKQASDKSEDDNEKLQSEFSNEVSIWRLLKHVHILPLVAVFSNSFATFCIMEMSTGGTLFDLVRSNRRVSSASLSPRSADGAQCSRGRMSEANCGLPIKQVQHYLRQLASALGYLHQEMRIVHRDIKLENCLLSTHTLDAEEHAGMKVLLCDFGMADFINTNEGEDDVFNNTYGGHVDPTDEDSNTHIIGPSDLSTNIAGSLEYASPELIRANRPLFIPSIDIWAFGVVSHALLTLDLPFRHSLQPKLQMMILQGLWNRDVAVEACKENPSGAELVQQCLCMEAQSRWNIGDVVGCTFLT